MLGGGELLNSVRPPTCGRCGGGTVDTESVWCGGGCGAIGGGDPCGFIVPRWRRLSL